MPSGYVGPEPRHPTPCGRQALGPLWPQTPRNGAGAEASHVIPRNQITLYTKHLWPESRRPRGSEFLHPVNKPWLRGLAWGTTCMGGRSSIQNGSRGKAAARGSCILGWPVLGIRLESRTASGWSWRRRFGLPHDAPSSATLYGAVLHILIAPRLGVTSLEHAGSPMPRPFHMVGLSASHQLSGARSRCSQNVRANQCGHLILNRRYIRLDAWIIASSYVWYDR